MKIYCVRHEHYYQDNKGCCDCRIEAKRDKEKIEVGKALVRRAFDKLDFSCLSRKTIMRIIDEA